MVFKEDVEEDMQNMVLEDEALQVRVHCTIRQPGSMRWPSLCASFVIACCADQASTVMLDTCHQFLMSTVQAIFL